MNSVMLSCGENLNICYVKYCLDRRTLRRSSCGPLVPGEWESLGLSPCPPPAGSTETQGLPRCPPVAYPHLLPRRSSLVFQPGSASPPALPEAESPLHRSLHHREADKWCHLPPSTPSSVSYSPCIPHLNSQALLSICPRHRRTGSTTSSRSSRGTRHLPSMRNLGLPSMGWPLGISNWLGGLRARGKILGGLGWCSGSFSFHRFPSQPPRPARTQRPWLAPSSSWRRGYCQGVTVITVTSVTTNYTHQIQLTWLLINATSHQEHYINGLHTLVSNIPCWLTWPSYLLSTVSSFLCSAPRSPPLLCSTVSCAPFLPLVPLDKVKDWLLTDKTL